MAIIATNAVQIARFANALYGTQLGSVTNAAVLADITAAGGLDNALNNYYASDFGAKTSAQVAAILVANLGIVAGQNGLTAAAVTDASNYIVGTLNAATASTRGTAVKNILNLWANIANDATLGGTYGAAATAWGAQVVAAQAYTASNAGDISTTGGVAVGRTFPLTINQDNLTGTPANDTFNAGVAATGTGGLLNTLQNIDQINGGDGADVLNVTLNGGAVTPSLTSVESIVLRSTTAGSELNLSGSTGTTGVTVSNSTADATLTSIGAASVNVANQSQAVNIKGSTATALSLGFDTVGKSTAFVAVDLGAGAANAATSFAITTNNAYVTLSETTAGAATTSASITATGKNGLTFAAADALTLTTVTVSGAGSVDLSASNLAAIKTLTAGDGGLKAVVTNATANTVTATSGAGADALTFNGAGIKAVSTGAGDDKVTTTNAAIGANATVDLGAGDDSVTLSNAPTAGATLVGGDGTDTIGLAKADYLAVSGYTATDLAKITGFEVLSITDALATPDAAVDLSKISGITSFKAAAGVTTANTASVINLGANSSVELAGADTANGQLTASLKADTSADSLTLILNRNFTDNNSTDSVALNAASQTVVLADIESLTVKSTGTNTSLPFTAVDGYKADTITNTLALTGSNKLTRIAVTGDQKLVVAATADMKTLAAVDASANTAGLSFDGSLNTSKAMTITGSAAAANTLIGGSKADTIVGGAKADSITGGAGGDTLTGGAGNDTFSFTTPGDSVIGTGTFDTITDFKANTYGAGTSGAVDTHGAVGVSAANLNGDLIKIAAAVAAATDTIKTFVASNAADATTFLANNKAAATVTVALDSSTGNLYIDNVGADGVADLYIHLTGVTTIDAAAILLV